MADQSITQNIASLLEQILGSGLVLNGQIGVNGLTVTSVDKAKELGIVEQQSQQSGQSNQGGQSSQQQNDQKESSGGQNKQQSGDQQQLSRKDYESLREEIGYLRKLLESTQQNQQNQSESKGKSSQGE